ncbi:hypothetical protein CPB84DRAFT_1792448 [Gymnopilus junonius]|uniref:Uncharacterized protein n=1 Tax=Gymnopilus junonius TaxID=109634 RepID=A0A9P5NFL6_GYMJU|nr:hypothetical protein CPB84DRAFT_1792448 [Gymnopilus junonius]
MPPSCHFSTLLLLLSFSTYICRVFIGVYAADWEARSEFTFRTPERVIAYRCRSIEGCVKSTRRESSVKQDESATHSRRGLNVSTLDGVAQKWQPATYEKLICMVSKERPGLGAAASMYRPSVTITNCLRHFEACGTFLASRDSIRQVSHHRTSTLPCSLKWKSFGFGG